MKFIPILFSTEMVQAILAGRKTQTRRVIKDISIEKNNHGTFNVKAKSVSAINIPKEDLYHDFLGIGSLCPYGQVGDVLWVRENFCAASHLDNQPISVLSQVSEINYIADLDNENISRFLNIGRTRPCIHMPKWACRIFLQIKDIRVERLNDISQSDAKAEGIAYSKPERFDFFKDYTGERYHLSNPIESFRSLWHKINGPTSWVKNPWVWVIEFERIKKPENF